MWLVNRLIIIVFVSFSLSGCVMMNSHSVPVKLERVEFVKANPFGQRFRLNFSIQNDQSKKLFVRTLDYKIMVNGIQITKGEEQIWQEIPAFSTSQVNILVSTNIWEQLKSIAMSIKNYKQIDYYLTGSLVTGNFFQQRVSYINHTGSLTPDQLPMKKLQKLKKLAPTLNF